MTASHLPQEFWYSILRVIQQKGYPKSLVILSKEGDIRIMKYEEDHSNHIKDIDNTYLIDIQGKFAKFYKGNEILNHMINY